MRCRLVRSRGWDGMDGDVLRMGQELRAQDLLCPSSMSSTLEEELHHFYLDSVSF